ncbi:MAG: hypothetical protein COZ47_03060 [Lysobacterales bacterium CG_4_10_14_3_um_filter_64_11]|nr:MAG: hypothetical protein COZ47_03060 [Xanthomonadales bacterium CG_4_10_14_3_um_filter_64_11]
MKPSPGLTTGQRRRNLAGMDRFILAVVFGPGLAAFGWALFAGMGVLAALLFAIAIDIAAGALLLLALWIGVCGLHVLVGLSGILNSGRRPD